MSLKTQIQSDMKDAMRARDQHRLGVIRLLMAAIKQREVDEQTEMDDAQVLAILDKMVKQRRESITQYQKAGRDDLADAESAEVEVLQAYLPPALTVDEIEQMISDAIEETGASEMRDMGKVMGIIKPQAQGRADMGAISGVIKAELAG